MSGIGESTEFGLRWDAIGLKTHGKMCREIANDLNVYFATVSHWCKNWETGEYLEDKPRSGIGPQHWIQLRRLFHQNLLQQRQSTRNLSRRLSNHEHQVSHMSVQRYLSKKCVACAYRRTKIPKFTEEHGENWLKFFRTCYTGPKKIGVGLFSVVRVLKKFIHQKF